MLFLPFLGGPFSCSGRMPQSNKQNIWELSVLPMVNREECSTHVASEAKNFRCLWGCLSHLCLLTSFVFLWADKISSGRHKTLERGFPFFFNVMYPGALFWIGKPPGRGRGTDGKRIDRGFGLHIDLVRRLFRSSSCFSYFSSFFLSFSKRAADRQHATIFLEPFLFHCLLPLVSILYTNCPATRGRSRPGLSSAGTLGWIQVE